MYNSSNRSSNNLKKESEYFNFVSSHKLINKRRNSNLKIKICGICFKEDLKEIENNGADLIGFINIKRSLRYVKLEKIVKLSRILDDKDKMVLVIEPKNVREALDQIIATDIRNIQLHSLSPAEIRELLFKLSLEDKKGIHNSQYLVIRAIGISAENLTEDQIQKIKAFALTCQGILFDYLWEGKTGGSGKEIPLKTALKAAKIVRSVRANSKIFLAGGVHKARINREGKSIKQLFDYVDFNSTLEDFPGKKNHFKIKEAIRTVRELKY